MMGNARCSCGEEYEFSDAPEKFAHCCRPVVNPPSLELQEAIHWAANEFIPDMVAGAEVFKQCDHPDPAQRQLTKAGYMRTILAALAAGSRKVYPREVTREMVDALQLILGFCSEKTVGFGGWCHDDAMALPIVRQLADALESFLPPEGT